MAKSIWRETLSGQGIQAGMVKSLKAKPLLAGPPDGDATST
ncbi:hypothetical protein [[Phormidium] sp. ETS-05]|nr:hypothetical protein [[Phormidium] sp. ETS-05]